MISILTALVLIYGASGQQNDVDITGKLNEVRQSVANGSAPKLGGGHLPSSPAMFTLTQDKMLGFIAYANAHTCVRSSDPHLAHSASMNFYSIKHENLPSNLTDKKPRELDDGDVVMDPVLYDWIVNAALTEWKQEPYSIDDDVVYSNANIQNFANMIYYQTTKFGYHLQVCKDPPLMYALVCVFNKAPILNSPLYIVSQTNVNGCASDSDCEQALPFAKCNATTGLCSATNDTNFKELPSTTSTTTASKPSITKAMAPTTSTATSITTRTTATTPGSHGIITEKIRLKIIDMHNYRRSRLAQGLVQNGRTGGMLPAGSNIFNMSYSMELEKAAQEYANTCPSTGSTSLSTMGENFASISSNTMTIYDCVINAIKSFWSQIKTEPINLKVMFTERLMKRPNGPLKFTQMAWSATRQVGCGVQRCGPNTVVVCRYSPRGNIVNQAIYKMGPVCSACSHRGCTTDYLHRGLCSAPVT